jgi:hypothetical protein
MSALTIPAPVVPVAPPSAPPPVAPPCAAVVEPAVANGVCGFVSSPSWNLSEPEPVAFVVDTSRDEPLCEFPWNEDIYQATLKAKAFGE